MNKIRWLLIALIVCLSVELAMCFFQQPFMFNNNFQVPPQFAMPFPNNMWMNNGWNGMMQNPAAGFGWNNFGSGFNTFPASNNYYPFGNNAYTKNGYGKQVITTPAREGYDIEYEFPGGRAKKYYASQSFVQQVL